jgi:hypothetical protein
MGEGGKRWVRRSARALLALFTCAALLSGAACAALWSEYRGEPSAAARGTGHDALWLGHAWVDGRKTQSDVDSLVERLRTTGIRELLVHSGPFADDGTLDPGRYPRARWFIDAVHRALPGVRVQAWLGAHRIPADPLPSMARVLDEGFDGIHYDFEPVADGDPALPAVLRATRALTKQRGAVLSVSAIHNEPWRGVAACMSVLTPWLNIWSESYLRAVAREVDQVALMAYDTALPTEATYGGYVRRATEAALRAVPADVALYIGIPAYHDQRLSRHDNAETVAAALRGIRLAIGDRPPAREFGVAIYVDFAATEQDWAAYQEGWAGTPRRAGETARVAQHRR